MSNDPPIQENNQVFPVPVGFTVDQRIRLVVQSIDGWFYRRRRLHQVYPVAKSALGNAVTHTRPISVCHVRECVQDIIQAAFYTFSVVDYCHLSF
jgi:hypothetical protein